MWRGKDEKKIPDWFQTAKEGLKGAALSFWKIQIALMCIGWEMRQGAIYNSYCPAPFCISNRTI